MIWNFTRGIESGEVIYALNYNINEDQDDGFDGVINAEDAAYFYPQGHGDAYGHYLQALKGYYSLLIDDDFTWAPRIEAVNVLGVPVSVDYLDERKFASAALSVAETGRQVFDLTWRQSYDDIKEVGWDHFEEKRTNPNRDVVTTRFWGLDHWASRTGQGNYLNWIAGNAMLPDEDPDPNHEGIQVVDRTTVTELAELAMIGGAVQTSMDNAEAGLNPLGLPEGAIAFDLSSSGGSASGSGFASGVSSHFEQILDRAKSTLRNAVVSFDDAKDVTRTMRSEEDSLADFQAKVASQERAYLVELIELYGTPYPEDIGPGKTYDSGYIGPDLAHYMYVDDVSLDFGSMNQKNESHTYRLDMQVDEDFETQKTPKTMKVVKRYADDYSVNEEYVEYTLDAHGYYQKPLNWRGNRSTPGKVQMAIRAIIQSHNALQEVLRRHEVIKVKLDRELDVFEKSIKSREKVENIQDKIDYLQYTQQFIQYSTDKVQAVANHLIETGRLATDAILAAIPAGGQSNVGTTTSIPSFSAARGTIFAQLSLVEGSERAAIFFSELFNLASFISLESGIRVIRETELEVEVWDESDRKAILAIEQTYAELILHVHQINDAIEALHEAELKYRSLEGLGLRLLEDRLIYRTRAAAITQGYRTRNAAFRLFRNEKLERYKSLFDLAARYAYLAAQAYDYDTGLLNTEEGRGFVQRIVGSRALGVVTVGEPQFAGSNNGDPGLSSTLAEMEADWKVLKGRLGFNNPDVYGTTVSLRQENYRILPGIDGEDEWKDVLESGRVANLMDDKDIQRYCMQIDPGDGLPVPGIVIPFSTIIANKVNLFGRDLAAGDSAFSPSSFANKIFSVGVVLDGYIGMADPPANIVVVGGSSPTAPNVSFLTPNALSATPYVYLVPVGADAMRSPALGDVDTIRVWNVNDVAIPLPFNIGSSNFSENNFLHAGDTLTEPLFRIRKHQAFRPVSSAQYYQNDNGRLLPSEFTNNRLIGRSVWNTQWKLIIPGHTLLANPDEGLDRFVRTVKDIKLHFETYSYSGN